MLDCFFGRGCTVRNADHVPGLTLVAGHSIHFTLCNYKLFLFACSLVAKVLHSEQGLDFAFTAKVFVLCSYLSPK